MFYLHPWRCASVPPLEINACFCKKNIDFRLVLVQWQKLLHPTVIQLTQLVAVWLWGTTSASPLWAAMVFLETPATHCNTGRWQVRMAPWNDGGAVKKYPQLSDDAALFRTLGGQPGISTALAFEASGLYHVLWSWLLDCTMTLCWFCSNCSCCAWWCAAPLDAMLDIRLFHSVTGPLWTKFSRSAEKQTPEPFRSGVEPQAQRRKVTLLMIDLEN